MQIFGDNVIFLKIGIHVPPYILYIFMEYRNNSIELFTLHIGILKTTSGSAQDVL